MLPTSYERLIGTSICDGRYELQTVLGVGAFGVVFRAMDHGIKALVAIKCLQSSGLTTRQQLFLRREIALHQMVSSHPNVVTVHRVLERFDLTFIVLDFCPSGDLFGMITEKQRYLGNDALISSIFLQIIDSVTYLHAAGVYHRDLKPENILCEQGGHLVKLADFGLATSDKLSRDFGCGSSYYISPETAGGLGERLDSYHPGPNDVWALGVILVNLSTGRNPWRTATLKDDTFLAYLRDPEYLWRILPISPACHAVLKAIFTIDPRRRVSLRRLRDMVELVGSWTMTREEIEYSGVPGREAAKAVAKEGGPVRANAAIDKARRALEEQQHYQTASNESFRNSAASHGSMDAQPASCPGSGHDSNNYVEITYIPRVCLTSTSSEPPSSSPSPSGPTSNSDTSAPPLSTNITLVTDISLVPGVSKKLAALAFHPDVASVPPPSAAPLQQDPTLAAAQSLVDMHSGIDPLHLDESIAAAKAAVLPTAADLAGGDGGQPKRPKAHRRMSSFFLRSKIVKP